MQIKSLGQGIPRPHVGRRQLSFRKRHVVPCDGADKMHEP